MLSPLETRGGAMSAHVTLLKLIVGTMERLQARRTGRFGKDGSGVERQGHQIFEEII